MRKILLSMLVVLAVVGICYQTSVVYAGEAAAPAEVATAVAGSSSHAQGGNLTIWVVITSTGPIGILIWVALFCNLGALAYFIAECSILLRTVRIMPASLVSNVTSAMEEGDVLKALQYCESEPGPLANILTAGFSNVEEGFETIQDMVGAAAEMESEKLMQRVTYLNVISNMGPLLGLLGTVHGMIFAFATLATTAAGAAQQAMLAINIAEALYCTATGLMSAIPALGSYYFFKNLATRITLSMEALTLNLIKSLRNVEVVE